MKYKQKMVKEYADKYNFTNCYNVLKMENSKKYRFTIEMSH